MQAVTWAVSNHSRVWGLGNRTSQVANISDPFLLTGFCVRTVHGGTERKRRHFVRSSAPAGKLRTRAGNLLSRHRDFSAPCEQHFFRHPFRVIKRFWGPFSGPTGGPKALRGFRGVWGLGEKQFRAYFPHSVLWVWGFGLWASGFG